MSWQQLLTIARQNEEWDRYWRAQQPRACPNDGTPLTASASEGTLRCPHDGWEYPRDWDPDTMAGM